jgi:hypothetical protein
MAPDLYRREKVALAIWMIAIAVTVAMVPLGLLADPENSMAHLRMASGSHAPENQQPLH